MIARAMQRSCYGAKFIHTEEILKFNEAITSWPPYNSTQPKITYDSGTGIFSITQAALHDFLVTWSVSLSTSSLFDGFADVFLLKMNYGNGAVTEGCFSCCTTGTGLVKSFKMIHSIRKNDANDLLKLYVINNGFYNDMALTTPRLPVPEGFTENTIFNANISIFSI